MLNAKKVIYSLRVYLLLEKYGFYPISTCENPNKPGFVSWIYDKTPEFVLTLNDIIEGVKK